MSQEQLTLLVALIGFTGVIVGSILGFLSTFLLQKWQEEIAKSKERREIIEKRLFEVEDFLSQLIIILNENSLNAFTFAESINEKGKASEKREGELLSTYDKLMEYRRKDPIINKLGVIEDETISSLIISLQDDLLKYDELFSLLKDMAVNGAKNPLLPNHILTKTSRIIFLYQQLILRIDQYKLEQLGYKKRKRSAVRGYFDRIIHKKKPNVLPKP